MQKRIKPALSAATTTTTVAPEPVRRRLLYGALVSAALLGSGKMSIAIGADQASCGSGADWPLWQAFVERHIQSDGRVIDHATERLHSTSEGQSYAMVFCAHCP